MEKVFKKLLGKLWIVFRGCATSQELYNKILTDTQKYLRRVVSSECVMMDLEPKRLPRSKSMPCLRSCNTL